MKCSGPGRLLPDWTCDMLQHGLVDGRCNQCQLLAEAASNFDVEEAEAVLTSVRESHRPRPAVLDMTDGIATMGSYTMDADCTNCGWAGTVKIEKGVKAPGIGIGDRRAKCPNCECLTIQARRR